MPAWCERCYIARSKFAWKSHRKLDDPLSAFQVCVINQWKKASTIKCVSNRFGKVDYGIEWLNEYRQPRPWNLSPTQPVFAWMVLTGMGLGVPLSLPVALHAFYYPMQHAMGYILRSPSPSPRVGMSRGRTLILACPGCRLSWCHGLECGNRFLPKMGVSLSHLTPAKPAKPCTEAERWSTSRKIPLGIPVLTFSKK